jgi:hypothetical protein
MGIALHLLFTQTILKGSSAEVQGMAVSSADGNILTKHDRCARRQKARALDVAADVASFVSVRSTVKRRQSSYSDHRVLMGRRQIKEGLWKHL